MINVIDNDGGVYKTYEFVVQSIEPQKLGELDLRLSTGDVIEYGEKIIITYTDGTKQTINKSWFL